ncbi:MAG: hypothetical protein KDC53_07750 [Saprospiraceae bacterium]|nr:hypothetical protein [Saprospiraceae bacterium]
MSIFNIRRRYQLFSYTKWTGQSDGVLWYSGREILLYARGQSSVYRSNLFQDYGVVSFLSRLGLGFASGETYFNINPDLLEKSVRTDLSVGYFLLAGYSLFLF